MNITMLVGNLTRDPEKVEGQDLTKFTIAVNENFTKADGTRPVQYYNVAVWNKLSQNCLTYLKKGSKVAICGKFQTRSYEKDGEKKYVTEIVANEIEFISTPQGN